MLASGKDLARSENCPELVPPEEGCLHRMRGGERGKGHSPHKVKYVKSERTWCCPCGRPVLGSFAVYISSHSLISWREQESYLIQKTEKLIHGNFTLSCIGLCLSTVFLEISHEADTAAVSSLMHCILEGETSKK